MSFVTGDEKLYRDFSPPTQPLASDGARQLRIGLVNNMSDGAIMRTEHQFRNLLQQSGNGASVQVVCYSLPDIPRSGKIQEHIAASYQPIGALREDPPDAIIVTGAEPRSADLRDEPYWGSLASLIGWLDDQGIPAMFSCLAAHAAVLRLDGISRAALDDKCFGVFEHEIAPDEPLMDGAGARMWLPHTRWNQVSERALVNAGYQILSWSKAAGVGFFARERRGLWLFCQGHPEYDGPDLLREYRRDVARFLSGERATYPELPHDYFRATETQVLGEFRRQALARGDVSIMDTFPRIQQGASTWDAWRPAAISVFGNWLNHVAAIKQLPGTLTGVAGPDRQGGQRFARMDNYVGDAG
jgi:homoserine O-succinyltransferase